MAASIEKYSDIRLFGATLVQPFGKSYEWLRTASHPLHPKCNLITECFFKMIKILTGSLALVAMAPLACMGRLIQIAHYHSLLTDTRKNPQEITVKGLTLPTLTRCTMPAPIKFHGTTQEGALGILRWGFNPSRTQVGSKMGEAVYVSASDSVSVHYGDDQLVLELDLKENEIAYITNSDLEAFIQSTGLDLSTQKGMADMHALFYQNGYRAIKYDLDCRGQEEAWAVYDPSCISIIRINPSPETNAQAAIYKQVIINSY
jgi:hypothetical protein